MKLSAPDWCFFDGSVPADEYYASLREYGYTAVEMVEPSRRGEARKAGLLVLNHGVSGFSEGLCDPSTHETLIPQICEDLRAIAADQIPHAITFSGNGTSPERGLAACEQAYRRILHDAAALDTILIFEMFCEQNHPGYEALSSSYGFQLARNLGSPRFKVLYDAYHMHRMNEDVHRDIDENSDLIAHIHIAEPPERGIPVPHSHVNWKHLVHAARDAGYAGYYGLEFMPSGDRLQAAKHAADLFLSF